MLIVLDGYFISKSFILHVVVRLSAIEQTQAIFWYCILRIYFLCGKIKNWNPDMPSATDAKAQMLANNLLAWFLACFIQFNTVPTVGYHIPVLQLNYCFVLCPGVGEDTFLCAYAWTQISTQENKLGGFLIMSRISSFVVLQVLWFVRFCLFGLESFSSWGVFGLS